MEGISDIKICGIDETRPPRVRKQPYINLYFKLSHKAPVLWCDAFNHLVAKRQYSAKITPADGLFIETWVRKPEEIPPVLEGLKEAVKLCNEEYIARIQAEARAEEERGGSPEDEGEQGHLNRIVAGLDFDCE